MKPNPTSEPTAAEWRDAFYAVENLLDRLESRIKTADFLAGYLADKAGDPSVRVDALSNWAEATSRSVFHVVDAMKEANDAYYVAFNDLVAREYAALEARTAVVS